MTETREPQDPQSVLRITHEEAASSHVDDLLRRQLSLRGEPGVSRERRRWYYQKWFLLGLAGMLGALVGWGVVEPRFNDLLPVQGVIERVGAIDADVSTDLPEAGLGELGYLLLRGERTPLLLLEGTRLLRPDGRAENLDPGSLRPGESVTVYADYDDSSGPEEVAVAMFVRPGAPSAKTAPSLRVQAERQQTAGLLLFPLVAACIGLFVGAADGIICRQFAQAALAGLVGVLTGFIGGFISLLLAGMIYLPLSALATQHLDPLRGSWTTSGLMLQMLGRALAWSVAGTAMGLGHGIARRSSRLVLHGLLGGIIGGLFGGLLFDPIDLIFSGSGSPSAHISRMVGFGLCGLAVGVMIGVVELLVRDAWLRMVRGPLVGKEFLVFKDTMKIGASPHSDIYLFNDPAVAPAHAVLRLSGSEYDLEAATAADLVLVNGRPVRGARLRHGDEITIGRTAFVFQRRQG